MTSAPQTQADHRRLSILLYVTDQSEDLEGGATRVYEEECSSEGGSEVSEEHVALYCKTRLTGGGADRRLRVLPEGSSHSAVRPEILLAQQRGHSHFGLDVGTPTEECHPAWEEGRTSHIKQLRILVSSQYKQKENKSGFRTKRQPYGSSEDLMCTGGPEVGRSFQSIAKGIGRTAQANLRSTVPRLPQKHHSSQGGGNYAHLNRNIQSN
ncbi:hypothetical protein DPEC_G00055130 [Dallia pectoralis]|uniref:Uncharacterized protein n=1 Tax=Dallia pectoralis TaxID=75939 RepID=A0ACC2H585_DALPE|nr:hypothetical protein DPEC_G00055130 [Dallia pectoralis]